MTLEEMFCKEFTKMMNMRKAMTGAFDLQQLDVSPESVGEIVTKDKVYIKGIEEEYFKELNDTEAIVWSGGKLKRRKFDYKSDYILDKNGKYITEDVTVPHDSIAIISDKKIGVPTRFKSKENFINVEMVQSKEDPSIKRYIYIVPRQYCYKLNQTALVLSLNKMRTYYNGVGLAMKNGYTVFVYIIPYKPTHNTHKPYRILCTKTDIDYSKELYALQKYWLERGYIFKPEDCQILEGYKGRENMAYENMPVVLDEYIRYDEEKNMSTDEDDLSNLWEGAE